MTVILLGRGPTFKRGVNSRLCGQLQGHPPRGGQGRCIFGPAGRGAKPPPSSQLASAKPGIAMSGAGGGTDGGRAPLERAGTHRLPIAAPAPLEVAPPRLELVGMTKRFGSLVALDDVSLTLGPGSFHALLGENGAGKSTLVKCVMGYYASDKGAVIVDDVAC